MVEIQPPTKIQGKHATTTAVDFQQGTVKVTLSSIGNVANHRASFTDCVGASGRGWSNDVEGKKEKKRKKKFTREESTKSK